MLERLIYNPIMSIVKKYPWGGDNDEASDSAVAGGSIPYPLAFGP